eukprot:gb/GFBE01083135.1/.p1 GENE.gb/GFBE01083135.1/~~gb/GFBE01083135.1/.p1  ORF type:complete len:116 (+),score=26.60 gb/GFBE01083135.1/:1-348(+)
MTAITDGSSREFSKSTLYEGLPSVLVKVGGEEEGVTIDTERGPMVLQLDGTVTSLQTVKGISAGFQSATAEKPWSQMSSTEQTVALHIAAKKNRYIRQRLQEEAEQANAKGKSKY